MIVYREMVETWESVYSDTQPASPLLNGGHADVDHELWISYQQSRYAAAQAAARLTEAFNK